jgi:uncharacterized protein (DUF885 family)
MANASSQFEGLLDRYFEAELAENPPYAAMAGLKSGEGRLGHATLALEEKREARRVSLLRALDSISPRDLSNEQQLDRLALRSRLLREREDYARGRHALDPNAPEQLLGILLHELQRGEDEPRRAARNLRSLLREAPRFLGEAGTLIDRPERVWLNIMEQTMAGAGAL